MTITDCQIDFNGCTIGAGTVFDILSVEGIDDYEVRSNDQQLPSLWGVQAGGDFVNDRTFTIGVLMYTAEQAWAEIEDAWLPASQFDPTALLPLTFKFFDRPELQVECRVRRRGRARTSDTEVTGGFVTWFFEFNAPDPRLYSSTEQSAVAGSYVADSATLDLTAGSGAGLAFDLTVSSGADRAFDFTGVAGGGSIAVFNDGNVDTFPRFMFQTTTAMSAWHVINDTTGEQASFAFALPPGNVLTADMAGVATGSTVPPVLLNEEPNYALWQSPRIPVRLVPGLNVLRFFVDSGTASGSTCTVIFRSAWL